MSRRTRNVIAIVLLLASYVAFVPGIFQPLVTLTASFEMFGNKVEVFRETRSLLSMIDALHDSGNDFVAGLILLFGIVVPVVKGLLLGGELFLQGSRSRHGADVVARVISKWAMNDVFVVAVYVAFLSARATDNLDAQLEPGFFWFTTYVLLSVLSTNFLSVRPLASGDGSHSRSITSGR